MVYFSPGDFLFNLLETFRLPLVPIFSVAQAISKSETVAKIGVDGVLFHPGGGNFGSSLFASLLIGTISGCGGGILGSMINVHEYDWKFSTPIQFKSLNSSMILSFICSSIYLILHRGFVIQKVITGTPLVFFSGAQIKKFGFISDQFLTQEQTIALMVTLILISNCLIALLDILILKKNISYMEKKRDLNNKGIKTSVLSKENRKKKTT